MKTILNTAAEAETLSADIHRFLMVRRANYNARVWSDLDKSATEEKWAVIIPDEYNFVGDVVKDYQKDWEEEIEDELLK